MLGYELKKNLRFSTFLFFAVILLLEFVSIRMEILSVDPGTMDEQYYIQYTKKWNGPLTQEKENEILKERAYIEDILSREEDEKKAYLNDEINKEQYDAYLEKLSYCRDRREAFDRFFADYEYVKAETEKSLTSARPEIFYKQYWNRFFSPDRFDYFAVIFLVFIAIGTGFADRDNRMEPILCSSSNGRYAVFKSKLNASGAVAAAATSFICLERCLLYYKLGFMPNAEAPMSSIEVFSGTGFPVPVIALAVIVILGNIFASVMTVRILVALSYLISKKMTEIAAAAVLLFGAELIKGIMPSIYAYMPGSFANVCNVFRFSTLGDNVFLQIILLLSVPLVYILAGAALRVCCRGKMKF